MYLNRRNENQRQISFCSLRNLNVKVQTRFSDVSLVISCCIVASILASGPSCRFCKIINNPSKIVLLKMKWLITMILTTIACLQFYLYRSCSSRDRVCGTPVSSSTNKTDRHEITEILSKVV